MASDSRSNPFIKQLAANDKRIRDKALESLKKYLSGRKEISEVDLLKLWKGLFFCMWMSDKPRTQQQLARDLASLVDLLHSSLTVPFLAAFWKTMAREWIGIDVLRMDKFLYLVRQMLNASFRQFARRRWKNGKLLRQYLDVLREVPLNPTEPKVPNGLRYHVVDVYVDELDKVDEGRDGECPVEEVLAPVRELAERCVTKAVRTRVRETLAEDQRLRDWNGTGEVEEVAGEKEEKEEGEGEWGGIDD